MFFVFGGGGNTFQTNLKTLRNNTHNYYLPSVKHNYYLPTVKHNYYQSTVKHNYYLPTVKHNYYLPTVKHNYHQPTVKHNYYLPNVKHNLGGSLSCPIVPCDGLCLLFGSVPAVCLCLAPVCLCMSLST